MSEEFIKAHDDLFVKGLAVDKNFVRKKAFELY
jgi:hypothetical protein